MRYFDDELVKAHFKERLAALDKECEKNIRDLEAPRMEKSSLIEVLHVGALPMRLGMTSVSRIPRG